MEHFEVVNKLNLIATENKEFFRIPTEQLSNEVIQFCEETDIERSSPEFIEIMNHMGLILIHGMMMDWEMAKLRAISKPPKQLPFDGDGNVD